jgi:GGDEF domain-containing protein
LGISIFPKDGDNIDMLLKNSDAAMYFAKQNGKNQFMFYKPNMIKGVNQ